MTDRGATLFGLALGVFGVWLLFRPRDGDVSEGGSIYEAAIASKITPDEAAQYAADAGFPADQIPIIVAIAQAESSLRTQVICDNMGKDPTTGKYKCATRYRGDPVTPGSLSADRGVLQINDKAHPDVSDDQAFDPAQAFIAGYAISMNATDYTPWSQYNNGNYQKFLA